MKDMFWEFSGCLVFSVIAPALAVGLIYWWGIVGLIIFVALFAWYLNGYSRYHNPQK